MADGGEAAAPRVAERLAAVCAHLEEIRADLRSGPGGDGGPVERVLAATRDSRDVAGTLEVLHADPGALARGGASFTGAGDRHQLRPDLGSSRGLPPRDERGLTLSARHLGHKGAARRGERTNAGPFVTIAA